MISDLSSVIQPGVDGVTGWAQVRLSKFVLFGPAKWRIAKTFLDDCMKPGQEKVEPCTLIRRLQQSVWLLSILRFTIIASFNNFFVFSLLCLRPVFTLHMRATGILLKVLNMLAFTPGGGSKTKIRPARNRFTGTCRKHQLSKKICVHVTLNYF